MKYVLLIRLAFVCIGLSCVVSAAGAENFTQNNERARLFGVHEVVLQREGGLEDANPFLIVCQVRFTDPAGEVVTVKTFYDGNNTWKARLYLTRTGAWSWRTQCEDEALSGCRGEFEAGDSGLRGKLRKHAKDPKQWMTDNGEWFLNLSDTAYRLFNKGVKQARFQRYVRDAKQLGFTSLRAGALGGWGWDRDHIAPNSEAQDASNWPWDGTDKNRFDLEKFRLTDRRLIYLLNQYPETYIQLIMFGLVEWNTGRHGQVWRGLPEDVKRRTMEYMVARWAAFPQIFWLIVNDLDLGDDRAKNLRFCRDVGGYLVENDPWLTLRSCGPMREQYFPFVEEDDLEWSTYIHLENNYNVSASNAEKYASVPVHVFAAEDRYEQDYKDKEPLYPTYYYRRLFWSWILAKGSANYGGRYPYIHPYSETGELKAFVQNAEYEEDPLVGADSLKHITAFFEHHEIRLAGWQPCDDRVQRIHDGVSVFETITRWFSYDTRRVKCVASEDHNAFILYHPNAVEGFDEEAPAHGRRINVDGQATAELRLDLEEATGSYRLTWFNPADGEEQVGEVVEEGEMLRLRSPWKGADVVALLRRQ